MNKKVCFFCVGTGGHVLPVRNLIKELKKLGTNNEDILVICDNGAGISTFFDVFTGFVLPCMGDLIFIEFCLLCQKVFRIAR